MPTLRIHTHNLHTYAPLIDTDERPHQPISKHQRKSSAQSRFLRINLPGRTLLILASGFYCPLIYCFPSPGSRLLFSSLVSHFFPFSLILRLSSPLLSCSPVRVSSSLCASLEPRTKPTLAYLNNLFVQMRGFGEVDTGVQHFVSISGLFVCTIPGLRRAIKQKPKRNFR